MIRSRKERGMSDLYNPWGEELELDSEDADRLRGLVRAWRLDDDQAAALLQIRVETWRCLRDGAEACLLDAETRTRIGHCFDVSAAIRTLAPDVDEGDWLRTGHPILSGNPPLGYLLEDDDALRSIRWTLLSDTDPTFPGGHRIVRGRQVG